MLKNLSKKSPHPTHSPVSNQHTLFPWTPVINPESRFSPSLKGDRLYRIPSRTVAHHRACCCLRGNVAIMPARRRGCCLARAGLFALNLPVALNPQKTHSPRLLFLAHIGPFVLRGPGKTEKSKMNSERGSGFRGLGGRTGPSSRSLETK